LDGVTDTAGCECINVAPDHKHRREQRIAAHPGSQSGSYGRPTCDVNAMPRVQRERGRAAVARGSCGGRLLLLLLSKTLLGFSY